MKDNNKTIKLAIPKGRMNGAVLELFAEAGVRLRFGARQYRPVISLENYQVKMLKPQNIVEMLDVGSRDIGFAGADWVEELDANLVELLDTELDPVKIVLAAPEALLENGKLPKRKISIASEYEKLTKNWIEAHGVDASFIRTYGATEVFPPEDADCIVDNTATGSTLRANSLEIVECVKTSSTRLYANPKVLDDTCKRERIEKLVLILKSVLHARERVIIELNCSKEAAVTLVELTPAMREPTVSELHKEQGYAIRAAVNKKELPTLIPQLKEHGASDIVVTKIAQIVP